MPSPVKISDKLLALARDEAAGAHRSTTAQIEHWATLGRAVETMVAYRDVLALKRAGETLPLPTYVTREDVHALLARLAASPDRKKVKARIRAGGAIVYAAHADDPDMVVEVRPDGTRTPGHLEGRKFVPAGVGPAVTKVAARRTKARSSR